MPHAVDEPALVERLFAEDLVEIVFERVARPIFADVRFDVLKHERNFQIGAAVFGSLQRTEGRRHGGIGVRAGRSNDVGGKRGVVAAAVFGMDDQADVQRLCFQIGEFIVPAQDVQNVLRAGIFLDGAVDDEGRPVVIPPCAVAVHGEEGELRDELQGLPQDVFSGERIGRFVKGIKVEHAPCQHIHDVCGGRLHDDVPHEGLGEFPQFGEEQGKIRQLFCGRQDAEEQKIDGFFKPETVFLHAVVNDVADVDAAIKKFAFDLRLNPVDDF